MVEQELAAEDVANRAGETVLEINQQQVRAVLNLPFKTSIHTTAVSDESTPAVG